MVRLVEVGGIVLLAGLAVLGVGMYWPEIKQAIDLIQHPPAKVKGLFADNPIVGRGVDERLSLPKINIPTSRVVANAAFIHDLSTEE